MYILVFGFALMAFTAAAHTGGFTFEKTIGSYFVDIGANASEITTDNLILFEFNAYPVADPNNLADFDSVYVTIGDESAIRYSGFIHRPEGMLTVMSYAFPKAGTYEMSARFNKGGEVLAEAVFPITVKGSAIKPEILQIALAFLALGLALGYWIGKKRVPSAVTTQDKA